MLRGILDNDSVFGQIMLRCWAIIACNLCFVITVIPVVTIGAGWAAMDYALMNSLKNRNTAAPFRDFWRGFLMNFRQATVSWLAGLAVLVFLGTEWYWCRQFGGIFSYFAIGILVIAVIVLTVLIHLFPTMAALKATIPQLIRNSIYFAFGNPLHLIVILFAHVVPMAVTYMDLQRLPMYAFLWCLFGFAAVGLLTVSLLLPGYMPYLKKDTEVPRGSRKGGEDAEHDEHRKSEAEILEEMQKLGM